MKFFRKAHRNQAEWLVRYREKLKQKPGYYVVLDLETTGLDSEKDSILSFAMLRIEQGEIGLRDRFEGFLAGSQGLNEASLVHQIVGSDHRGAYYQREFLQAMLGYIGNSVLVGHHIAMDLNFINQLMRRETGMRLKNQILDTAHLAVRLQNPVLNNTLSARNYPNLDELCAQYGIEPEARHTAAGDALTTAQLFLKLKKAALKRGIKLPA